MDNLPPPFELKIKPEANTHLIAAAPDLFEALSSIMDAMPTSKDRPSWMSLGQWAAAKGVLAKVHEDGGL